MNTAQFDIIFLIITSISAFITCCAFIISFFACYKQWRWETWNERCAKKEEKRIANKKTTHDTAVINTIV